MSEPTHLVEEWKAKLTMALKVIQGLGAWYEYLNHRQNTRSKNQERVVPYCNHSGCD